MGNLTSKAKRTLDEDDKDIIPSVRPSKRQKIAYNGCSHQGSDVLSHHSLNIIMTVWQTIEPFLTLEDTIASSKTCKTLHNTIIDVDTRKVKVSHFKFISKRETIIHFLPWALNSIHFPSLRDIQYPPTIGKASNGSVSQVTRNEIAEIIDACFPTFCTYLSQAHDLERLEIYLNTMMQCIYDNESSRKIFIGILGQNLSCCKKLKELTVVNMGSVTNDEEEVPGIFYSTELLKALTPVLSKRKDTLEVLKVSIYGTPVERDEELEMDLQVAQDFASQDFFGAILSTTNVFDLTLDIDFSSRCALALLKVAEERMRNGTVYQSNQLQNLKLMLDYGDDESLLDYDSNEVAMVPLMLSFSKCYSLQNIELDLPVKFWREKESVLSLSKLLKNKLHLTTLICDFNKFYDRELKVFILLKFFGNDCKNNNYPQLKAIELKRIGLRLSVFPKFNIILKSIPGSTRGSTTVLGGPLYTFERYVD